MEVIKITPRGYCKGVVNALAVVKQAMIDYPDQPIHIVGMIIHNKFVKEALKRKNVISHDTSEMSKAEIIAGITTGVVIFSAHGIAWQVKEQAQKQGLIVLDATCQDVLHTQDLIKEYLAADYTILYIGKLHHPEAEATLALSPKIKFISQIADIEALTLETTRIMVTNQTTMSSYDIAAYFTKIKDRFPTALFLKEICSATRIRQEAVMDTQKYDLVYVVGDKLSNNSNNLNRIAEASGCPALLVESARDLNSADFKAAQVIGVTSGASTPAYLTNQVIAYLKTQDPIYLEIDYDKIL